jgi:DNA-binding Lrp family transcriptional regulator
MKVWAYVFITTKQPRKVVQAIRQIPGVVKADGLFGSPDAIAIVEGEDIASMDAVIDHCRSARGAWYRLESSSLD